MEFNFDIKVNRDLKISLGNGAIFGDNINFYPSNTEEVTEVTDADFEEVIDEVRKEGILPVIGQHQGEDLQNACPRNSEPMRSEFRGLLCICTSTMVGAPNLLNYLK